MLLSILSAASAIAQPKQILEDVVALIGDNIILKSEWEAEYLQVKDQYTNFKDIETNKKKLREKIEVVLCQASFK